MPYLYVIRTPSGLRKVGHSTSPKRRCRELGAHNTIGERGIFTLEYERECFGPIIAAEIRAHALLADMRVKLEYFAVDLETARAAVDAVAETAEAGLELPPQPDPEPEPPLDPEYPPPSVRTIRFEARLSQEALGKLDYLRRLEPNLPSRAEMLYRLVMRLT